MIVRAGSRMSNLAILQCGERQGLTALFYIRREELMRMAKIRGKTTYFRVIGELAKWGFIGYWPSRDKGERSSVRTMGSKNNKALPSYEAKKIDKYHPTSLNCTCMFISISTFNSS